MLNILLDRLHKQQLMHKPFKIFQIFCSRRFIAFTRSTTLVKYPPRLLLSRIKIRRTLALYSCNRRSQRSVVL